ncbi:MAG TPA: tetratricopeptide repeat protein [Reyranella sp.]
MAPIISAGLALLLAACGYEAAHTGPQGDSYTAALQEADAARKAGDLDVAVPLYSRALQANPEGMDAKLGLGQCYLALGAGGEAAAQFRDVLAKRGGDTVARRGLAAALITQGQPELAEKQAEMALAANGHDYHALNVLGVSLDMQGRHAEAEARYREGIALAPDDVALRSNMGLSLAIIGQSQDAIAQLLPIATGPQADGRVRQNLAFAYAMGGDFENSLKVSRRDLDEATAQRQLSYFMQLKSLTPEERSAEMRRTSYFFPQTSSPVRNLSPQP